MEKYSVKDVAIVIPLSTRDELTEYEKVSLTHLRKHLSRYDTYYAAAKKVNFDKIDTDGITIKRFSNDYFGSVRNYNKLMSTRLFYKTFCNYTYVFIYHLDALVFEDELLDWCNKGYDLIAPPWIKEDLDPQGIWMKDQDYGVGNGGFSLRKVDSFLKVLNSNTRWEKPAKLAKRIAGKVPVLSFVLSILLFPFAAMPFINNVRFHRWYFIKYKNLGEDRFFGLFSQHYVKDFVLPPKEDAIKFAFETNCKRLFEANGYKLPFGCHKFEHEMDFWTQYLYKDNITI